MANEHSVKMIEAASCGGPQGRLCAAACALMSALPPIADIAERDWHVRFVPKAASWCYEPTFHVKLAPIYSSAILPIHFVALQISTDGNPN